MAVDDSFISQYVEFGKTTEAHSVYNRWCCISAIGALLGRKYYFPFGNFRIFPNLYIKCIGASGSRKSTAIKLVAKLVAKSGYEHFAAEKLRSIEKFLLDLEGKTAEEFNLDADSSSRAGNYGNSAISKNLWGDNAAFATAKEVYIAADEFNEYAGAGNFDFYSLLGSLWDWDNEEKNYEFRLKNSDSVSIFQPTINILGGNTQEGLTRAFPPTLAGQGFLSRVIFIYGERSDRRFHIPPTVDIGQIENLIGQLRKINEGNIRIAQYDGTANSLFETIYRNWDGIADGRFRPYKERRYTQLLKLCLICSAVIGVGTEITEDIIIQANTYLTAAERNMPAALGEFGKGKNSDVTNSVLDTINSAQHPPDFKTLWAENRRNLNKPQDLQEIVSNLAAANQIQVVKAGGGYVYLPNKVVMKDIDFVDFERYLTDEERKLL